jgi:hypothetical protein
MTTRKPILATAFPIAWPSGPRVYLFFLLTTIVLFAPFLVQGRVLLGNTDNLYTFYPNLIWGHNNLRSGDAGLWNPLLFAGMNGAGSMHLHMLNPINWVLLLVPNSLVLQAVTVKALLEISLIAFFVFLIAAKLVRDRLTAIACGLSFQLSGFVWYAAGMYYSVNMLLATVIYIYLLLTHVERRAFWNYFFLSISFAAIMFGGNPGYVIALLLPVPIVALILCQRMPMGYRVRFLGMIALSGATASALAGVRIISVTLQAAGTSRAAGFMPTPSLETVPGNGGAFLLPGLVPGVWGLNYYAGSIILRWLNAGDPNLQFAALAHFAVLPLLLIFLGVSGKLGRFAFVASALAVFLAFSDRGVIPLGYELVWAVLRPLHPIVLKAFCSFVPMAAVIFACRYVVHEHIKGDMTRAPLAICFVIVAACLQMWTKCIYNVPLPGLEPYRHLLELLLRFSTIGAVLCVIATLLHRKELPLRFLSNLIVGMYLVGAAVVGIFYYLGKLFTTALVLQSLLYMTAAVVCGAFTIAALRRWRVEDGDPKAWRLLLPVVAATVLVVAAPLPDYSAGPSESVIFAGAMLSIGRFLALAVVGIELLGFIQRFGWRPILPFTLVFLFSDAMLLSRTYENFGYKGFERPDKMYPSAQSGSVFTADAPEGPNLLEDELRVTPADVQNWSFGGVGSIASADPLEPGAAIVRGTRDSTLFRDVRLSSATHYLAFGAWVKSRDPRVAIGLTAKQTGSDPIGTPLVHHSGSGGWEWLAIPLYSGLGMLEARPHLFVFDSEGEIFGPVLRTASDVGPQRQPKHAPPVALAEASLQSENFDFTQYRVNFPQVRFGYPPELFSNIPMIYGIATYGGTDSTVDAELEHLLTAFVSDPKVITPYGVQYAITEPRILDLLGVRYDFKGNKIRPNALARFSIFSDFEVAKGFDAQLARLKDPSLNYSTTLVVDSVPGEQAAPSGAGSRFRPITYVQVSNSHVNLKASVGQPSVLLFNDSFSPDWHAYRSGRSIPVLRANAHFMAVSLPPGESEIDFRFEPERFYFLAKISIATAIALAVAGIWGLKTKRRDLIDNSRRRAYEETLGGKL